MKTSNGYFHACTKRAPIDECSATVTTFMGAVRVDLQRIESGAWLSLALTPSEAELLASMLQDAARGL